MGKVIKNSMKGFLMRGKGLALQMLLFFLAGVVFFIMVGACMNINPFSAVRSAYDSDPKIITVDIDEDTYGLMYDFDGVPTKYESKFATDVPVGVSEEIAKDSYIKSIHFQVTVILIIGIFAAIAMGGIVLVIIHGILAIFTAIKIVCTRKSES